MYVRKNEKHNTEYFLREPLYVWISTYSDSSYAQALN